MGISAEELATACSDTSQAGGLVITSRVESLAGRGAPVKPAIYEGGRFQAERRWVDDPEPRVVDAVVIDSVASQANRLEAALLRMRHDLGLPEIVLDLSGIRSLPVHLPTQLSTFRMPNRHADAYLRDSELGGKPFINTDLGKRLFRSTPLDPAAMLSWTPQSLLYGFWQSQLGKKRQQTKLARSWTSELVGFDPASKDPARAPSLGFKSDPLNLSIAELVEFDEADKLNWSVGVEKRRPKKGPKPDGASPDEPVGSLSEIGHGSIPHRKSGADPSKGVSFAWIEQQAHLSLAGLRRIECGSPEANSAGRALLASLGIVAHVAAFGRTYSLRSGCDLRVVTSTWTNLGESSDDVIAVPTLSQAISLFHVCVDNAAAAGLSVGARYWEPEPLVLQPGPSLRGAIEKSWPLLDEE